MRELICHEFIKNYLVLYFVRATDLFRPQVLLDAKFEGWCTVEQDCDPAGTTSPLDDARANRAYLAANGF